ncbi:hypothetical protein PY365_16730 [Roseiarcaceae bacterium H3SJ34-1]|uniref:hypothetical protein n=1 Tax=Terripilifer ovatus TaxID=3032367 RepID=UPI003AB98319|nr:hypothetical protein [Roseiarcaceae bacterium H3SJ34-1]
MLIIYQAKDFVERITGLPQPVLHLMVGLFLFGSFYLATKRIWLSLVVVFAIELVNEINDSLPIYLDNIHHMPRYEGWADNIDDFLWTMAAPTAIALVVSLWRYRQRAMFAGRIRPKQ